jgi:hypothetical protein
MMASTIKYEIGVFLYITQKTSENIGKTATDIANIIVKGDSIKLDLSEIDDADIMFAVMEGIEKVRYGVLIDKNIKQISGLILGRIELQYKHKLITIDTY